MKFRIFIFLNKKDYYSYLVSYHLQHWLKLFHPVQIVFHFSCFCLKSNFLNVLSSLKVFIIIILIHFLDFNFFSFKLVLLLLWFLILFLELDPVLNLSFQVGWFLLIFKNLLKFLLHVQDLLMEVQLLVKAWMKLLLVFQILNFVDLLIDQLKKSYIKESQFWFKSD